MTITAEQLRAASEDQFLKDAFMGIATLGSVDLVNELMRAERSSGYGVSTDMVILERLRTFCPQATREEIDELYINTLAGLIYFER